MIFSIALESFASCKIREFISISWFGMILAKPFNSPNLLDALLNNS